MRPKFTCSEEVRVVRAIRNDGTVAGFAPGALLVRRGSRGFVRDGGVFLQDQIQLPRLAGFYLHKQQYYLHVSIRGVKLE